MGYNYYIQGLIDLLKAMLKVIHVPKSFTLCRIPRDYELAKVFRQKKK